MRSPGSLQLVNISDPKHPTPVGYLNLQGNAGAYQVVTKDHLVFVAGGLGGLQIIDISDARNPRLINCTVFPGVTRGVTLKNELAIVASQSGLQVVNVSDPTVNPHQNN